MVIDLSTRAGELDSGKRKAEAERVIAEARQLIALREEALRQRTEAAEAGRQAQEDEYRAAARARLDALAASRGSRDVGSPRSFEYSVMELERTEAADYLNKAGSLGWELVSALPTSDARHLLYMKRDAWFATDETGRQRANAVPVAATAAAAGGMAFAGFYYESGPDLDADGDVDGGLFDNIQNLFS